jgi:hypothetical protein
VNLQTLGKIEGHGGALSLFEVMLGWKAMPKKRD